MLVHLDRFLLGQSERLLRDAGEELAMRVQKAKGRDRGVGLVVGGRGTGPHGIKDRIGQGGEKGRGRVAGQVG